MKLYFKDANNNLRGVESEWDLSVLDNQKTLSQVIYTGSGIQPKSVILALLEGETDGGN